MYKNSRAIILKLERSGKKHWAVVLGTVNQLIKTYTWSHSRGVKNQQHISVNFQ